ncbi:MAG TPA: tetratricopeptide repeat protein [Acetobacteraceae bacterium]|nr:tetratricopeptide repeat protein [Acetobacteraceae bacterium]
MRCLALAFLVGAVPALAHAQTPAENRAAANKLLDALKQAPSEAAAAPLEEQIRALWAHAGSPAVMLLMTRGLREMHADALSDAIQDFGDAIVLDPSMAEAYRERAVARYQAGDVPGAIADLQAAVQHEPRNFAAYDTLSRIAEDSQDWKGAYAAWQKVMEIDPKTPDGEQRLNELKRKALGEET